MNDFDRQPGGIEPDLDRLAPDDRADNTGGPGEPRASELDLPGPDDPVAWAYVEPNTSVVGPDGQQLGRVTEMLGTATENIFHGVAVTPDGAGDARVVPADAVTGLTSSKVTIAWDAEQLAAAEEFRPIGR